MNKKILTCIVSIGILYLFFTVDVFALKQPIDSPAPIWNGIIKALIKDGENPKYIKKLFSSPLVHFDPRALPRKLTHKEVMVEYKKFYRLKRINRAKNWMVKHKKLLFKIYKKYGVPPQIITAILLVETDLGRHIGRVSAFNMLASMAATKNFKLVLKYIPKKDLKHIDLRRLKHFARVKSSWAYNELKCLIDYAKMNDLNPLKIKGSIFGAIGLCQFMPSNAIKFGVDEDKDGKVNLFDVDDAVASMANYLKYFGWQNNLNKRKKLKVILQYNYSRPYAKTILDIANQLKSATYLANR